MSQFGVFRPPTTVVYLYEYFMYKYNNPFFFSDDDTGVVPLVNFRAKGRGNIHYTKYPSPFYMSTSLVQTSNMTTQSIPGSVPSLLPPTWCTGLLPITYTHANSLCNISFLPHLQPIHTPLPNWCRRLRSQPSLCQSHL